MNLDCRYRLARHICRCCKLVFVYLRNQYRLCKHRPAFSHRHCPNCNNDLQDMAWSHCIASLGPSLCTCKTLLESCRIALCRQRLACRSRRRFGTWSACDRSRSRTFRHLSISHLRSGRRTRILQFSDRIRLRCIACLRTNLVALCPRICPNQHHSDHFHNQFVDHTCKRCSRKRNPLHNRLDMSLC